MTHEHGAMVNSPAGQSQLGPSNSGFVGSLVDSIFQPGVNHSLFQAMNISFGLLLVTLFGLAFLTGGSWHVVFLMVVSAGLWMTMIWFVHEIKLVQGAESSQNAPPDPNPDLVSTAEGSLGSTEEKKKDR